MKKLNQLLVKYRKVKRFTYWLFITGLYVYFSDISESINYIYIAFNFWYINHIKW
jgi:hypothetical protein